VDEPKIFDLLIEATGLPKDSIQKELTSLLEKRGLTPGDATLDDLREILAHYLQDALIEAKEHTQDA
jgi:hypothetical protein